MATISLCMIAKDEEKHIGNAIGSVKPIVSQVVVVDTGSSDKTAEIAKAFGAEVYGFKWVDDFAAARNESLKYAKGDWVLVLDADETIAAADLEKIKALAASTEFDGFWLVGRYYTNDSYRQDFMSSLNDSYAESRGFAGWVPKLIVRLFRNKPQARFEGVVHESVADSIVRSGGKCVLANVPIHHYAELKGKESYERKAGFYRRLCEKKVVVEPDSPRAWFDLGIVERSALNFEKARECFERVIGLDGRFVEAFQSLGVCRSELGDLDGAIAAFSRAIELNPFYPTPYFSLGVAYARKRMLNEARDAILEGLKRNPSDFNALTNLGAIYEQGGHPEEAVRILQQVVSVDANNARAWYNLGVSLERTGRSLEAAAAYEKSAHLGYFRKDEALGKAAQLRGKS
ncbi:tetratricopeptide repeat protein [Candidatus Woesearchaeota archaeon]|nr:tetratricopeptide repeat protein [Candidatus Woesearchaeota archaeon]